MKIETGPMIVMILGLWVVAMALVLMLCERHARVHDLELPALGQIHRAVIVDYEQGSFARGGSGVIRFGEPFTLKGYKIKYNGDWILKNERLVSESEYYAEPQR